MSKLYFKEFYERYRFLFLKIFWSQMGRRETEIPVNDLWQSVELVLESICFRCLLTEFWVCKRLNQLQGKTIPEELEDYRKRYLSNMNYQNSIYLTYPQLQPYCTTQVENFGYTLAALCTHFWHDKKSIESKLLDGRSIQRIQHIEIGLGDIHHAGKSVTRFTVVCQDREEMIFYKYRSVMADMLFYRVLSGFDKEMCGCDSAYGDICRYVDKEDHGWMKYVDYLPCLEEEEFCNFYRRVGLMLGVCYFCGCGDLHFENLIAYRAYPVAVDLENIFRTDDFATKTQQQFVGKYSVLTSCLLPESQSFAAFSGVTGGSGGKLPYSTPHIIFDDNHFEITYDKPDIGYGRNKPGKYVNPADYEQDIMNGFCYAYKRLAGEEGEQLIQSLPGNLRSRVLIAGTQRYQAILEASRYPTLWVSTEAREKFICDACGTGETSGDEAEMLCSGEIPYFYRDLQDTALYSSTGKKYENYFEKNGLEALRERRRAMNEADIKRQCEFIHISLMISRIKEKDIVNGKYQISHYSEAQQTYHKDGWKKVADGIARWIKERAVWDEQHKYVSWVTIKYRDHFAGDLQVCMPDLYFYEGISGISVFLRVYENSLSRKDKRKTEYQELCEAVECQLFEYTDRSAAGLCALESSYSGALCGEASIVYAYQLLYQATGRELYLNYAKKHAEIVNKLIENDRHYDLLYGNAGAILIFCNLYDLTKDKIYLDYAQEAELCLHKNAGKIFPEKERLTHVGNRVDSNAVDTGIAHGLSGYLLCYGRLIKYFPDNETYFMNIKEILSRHIYELSGRKQESLPSWCHGILGTARIYQQLPKVVLERYADLVQAFWRLLNIDGQVGVSRKSFCICHGNLGNLFLEKAVNSSGRLSDITTKKEHIYQRMLSNKTLPLSTEEYMYGFYNGLSGIGYYSLFLAGYAISDIEILACCMLDGDVH